MTAELKMKLTKSIFYFCTIKPTAHSHRLILIPSSVLPELLPVHFSYPNSLLLKVHHDT